ncbi:hypothetical protein, partial [Acetobacter pasteurianus]|uniref:hypothetical protein n=1 Tax=Acetobacter pasteurianus TaxID=438 RepID=UPI001E5A5FAD
NRAPATNSIIIPYKSTADRHERLVHQTVRRVSTLERRPSDYARPSHARAYWAASTGFPEGNQAMSEDQEMREAIRARMKGRIRFNVATDRIEVIVGAPDELLRWEPINRLTMLQHLPQSVVERLSVSLETYLAERDRTTIAEVLKAVPGTSEKDLPNILKDAGWGPRRSSTERFWVKVQNR